MDINDLPISVKKMLAREFARKGGIARAKKLSPERRREIASMGGKGKKREVNPKSA